MSSICKTEKDVQAKVSFLFSVCVCVQRLHITASLFFTVISGTASLCSQSYLNPSVYSVIHSMRYGPQAPIPSQSSILSPFYLSIQLLSHTSSFSFVLYSFMARHAQAGRQFGQAHVHKNEQEIHWQWQVRLYELHGHLFHSSFSSRAHFSLPASSPLVD